MSVKDMIKKSVLESGAFTNYDVPGILTALAAALLLGAQELFFQEHLLLLWLE